MGRRKIEIKAIKDDRNRSVTFLKRKGGLFKKAHELSVLCSVDVAVIIFGHNKKLYEFSSGDIQETLGRYSYYGGPHEHKGPEDFMGKKEADDDDDEEGGEDERPDSNSPPTHAMMPHHLQNQPAFQHLGTPSVSPPMPNGTFHHRGPSPQPHPLSRPGSRTHIRHPSSNLAPPQHQHLQVTQPPPPQQPSYAYMPNPPIYNPQAAANLQMRPQATQPQPPQFQYAQHPQQQHPPQHPQHPVPHPQMQAVYQQEPRRPSMPPNMPPQDQRPAQPAPQPPPQLPQQQQYQQSPPLPQPKPLPAAAKTQSIFTPIDDSRSFLAQHWGTTTQAEQPRHEAVAKAENGPRSQSIDVAVMNRTQVNGVNGHQPPEVHVVQPTNGPSQPQRTASTPVMSSLPPQPPSRTNSLQTNRPRLKVQIPNESSDDEKQTGGSSPLAAGPNNAVTPIRAGAVLPPPSPSAASALLSAGASGPPNPFARPAPPATNGTFGGNRSDLETPISALPSRFMSEQLLGSPGSFDYWSFGKDNTLPSPLAAINFGQTPVAQNGPSFRDDDPDRKRKVSDPVEENVAKRIKA